VEAEMQQGTESEVVHYPVVLQREQTGQAEHISILDTTVTVGDLKVDLDRGVVLVGSERVHLTGTEFHILRSLLVRASGVIRREDLLAIVRSHTRNASSRSLDGHISRLRTKLGPHGKWIRTFKGVGYRFFPIAPL
jgi:DNA-binding response OmpR family regulator